MNHLVAVLIAMAALYFFILAVRPHGLDMKVCSDDISVHGDAITYTDCVTGVQTTEHVKSFDGVSIKTKGVGDE